MANWVETEKDRLYDWSYYRVIKNIDTWTGICCFYEWSTLFLDTKEEAMKACEEEAKSVATKLTYDLLEAQHE